MRTTATTGGVYGADASPSFYSKYMEGNPSPPGVMTPQDPGGSGAPVNVVTLGPWANHPLFGKPLVWFFGLVGVLLAYSYFEHKKLPTEKLGLVKIGLGNLFRVGLLAVIFLVLTKMIFAKYQVPGLSDIFLAA